MNLIDSNGNEVDALILQGDNRELLRELPSESVDSCVTSPPYWGLRDYKVEGLVWGGDSSCSHSWNVEHLSGEIRTGLGLAKLGERYRGGGHKQGQIPLIETERSTCGECGAWKGSLGLESTPELYVEHLVEVFREVRRVLKREGTIWVNLGDSYCNFRSEMGPGQAVHGRDKLNGKPDVKSKRRGVPGLKEKDLIGIPWRVAFALQADGWWLRSDIVWSKPNPMPSSVKDRPTGSHEYIFLMSKSQNYYYDQDSVREVTGNEASWDDYEKGYGKNNGADSDRYGEGYRKHSPAMTHPLGRNRRTVWTVATAPYKGAHFATFPPKLVEPCILAGTPIGGIVLDPFAGSGTVGKVALDHGRRAILMELNPDYCELIVERCK